MLLFRAMAERYTAFNIAWHAYGAPHPGCKSACVMQTEAHAAPVDKLLDEVLTEWDSLQATQCAHPSLSSNDQQQLVKWMVKESEATLWQFAKVSHCSKD